MHECWQVLPENLRDRLQKLLTPEQFNQVSAAFATKRPTTFRANTLKVSPQELADHLTAAGLQLEKVPWLDIAFILKNASLQTLSQHPLHGEGALYVQSLSSMIPPVVLDPYPGEKILDLTAAPGSKTTQMAAMMQNQGEIIANDLSPIRLFKLQANLKMQGVTIAHTRRGAGEYIWQKFPEYFDKTLVDVPCSMEGRICIADPDTYEDWSYRKVRDLSIRQAHLLRAAVTATKVGGVIVYSTCTLAPEENEAAVDWLLQREAGKVVLEEVSLPNLEYLPGICQWEKKTFHPDIAKTLRILPSSTMEGFFVAKFRKLASTLPTPSTRRRHSRHRR